MPRPYTDRSNAATQARRTEHCRSLVARIEALPAGVTFVAFFARAGVSRGVLSLMRAERQLPSDDALQALEDTLALVAAEGVETFVERAERCARIAMAVEARERGRGQPVAVHAADSADRQ